MPLYVADYLGDTRHLSTVQHGAYLLLIFQYWRAGGLPADDHQLATIAGLPYREWLGMKGVVSRFFEVTADAWKHRRIEHELEKARGKYAKKAGASEAAKAVREARKQAEGGEPIPAEKRLRELSSAEADLCLEATGVRRRMGNDLDVQTWREKIKSKVKEPA
jgi:uncharacterized protein YdaU (DUF1376 family)